MPDWIENTLYFFGGMLLMMATIAIGAVIGASTTEEAARRMWDEAEEDQREMMRANAEPVVGLLRVTESGADPARGAGDVERNHGMVS
jgi:hypothetical protein